MICNLCPRKCSAERNENIGYGYCKMPLLPKVARAALHMWEEPCISGKSGSGTVFFSGCSLGCVYCQNKEISHDNIGRTISVSRLAEIFSELEEKGAENINLVNPTHYCLAIRDAFRIYKPKIPVVYNSGGYESEMTMEISAEFTDIYLLDLKYLKPQKSLKYSGAQDYPELAKKAIMRAAEIIKQNEFNDKGIMTRGLIVRHLVLPYNVAEAKRVVEFLENNIPWAALSLMSQYTPCGDLSDYPEINRRLTTSEHRKVLSLAAGSRLETVYCQQLDSGSKEFIPNFDGTGV